MKIELPNKIDVLAFCKAQNISLELHMRDADIAKRCGAKVYVSTDPLVEVCLPGGILRAVSGDGNTPAQALRDLARVLSNNTVRISKRGTAFVVPQLCYKNER
jgi:uridine kinase